MIALGMLYLLVLEVIVYVIWFYNTRPDRQPRQKVIQWLIDNKAWDIAMGTQYSRIMDVEAIERQRNQLQHENARLQYRIDSLERDRAEFMSFYHKQIGIRDREIEFLKHYIKGNKDEV